MRQDADWQSPKLEQKLIFLYLLKQMEGAEESQLMQVALQLLYTDYFQYTLVRESLLDQGCISLEPAENAESVPGKAGTERCHFLPQGRRVLEILEADIPLPLRQSVIRAVENWRQTSTQAGGSGSPQVWTHFHSGPASPYLYLHSQGLERAGVDSSDAAAEHCGLDLRLPCRNEAEARRLSAVWAERASVYYQQLRSSLEREAQEKS